MFEFDRISEEQFRELKNLGLDQSNPPKVDEAIEWFRIHHNVIIYNKLEPFVDPTSHKIVYCYAAKWCNVRDGWNGRVLIGRGEITSNIFEAKRSAITLAINYLKTTKMQNPKLKPGDTILLEGMRLRVHVTIGKLSCNECQIHNICNRDPIAIHKIARQYGATNCMSLIGKERHFKIIT